MKSVFPIFFLLLPGLIPAQAQPGSNSPYRLPAEIESWLLQDTTPWKHQKAAWWYSYVGEYQHTLTLWDNIMGGRRSLSETEKAYFAPFKPAAAAGYICTAAAGSQIVIVNEAHHQPRHRVFSAQLLEGLYRQGFRYLALEDLNYADTLLHRRKYPVLSSGYYMVEPQFGDLVRQALAIGYRLVPYEFQGSGERELEQARNIQRIFETDKNAKVLIHCGFDHVIEGRHEFWEKAMAGWLKELTGLDPLTINQTEMTEKSREERCNPYFQLTRLPYSAVLLDSAGRVFNGPEGKNQYDILVFHPRTSWDRGRPGWLTQDSAKKWARVPRRKIRVDFPCLVEARFSHERADAVPIDVVVCKSPDDLPPLALYKGKYTLSLRDIRQQTQQIRLRVK
ncbi:MAG: hypothetical protein IPM81_01285 [Saprospirales bacterium]|nr:hypothetical protein [Saprospirales bacterium]